MFEISATASFEASHYIEADAGAAHYKRVHGHSFVVTASVASAHPDQDGWVMDLGRWRPFCARPWLNSTIRC